MVGCFWRAYILRGLVFGGHFVLFCINNLKPIVIFIKYRYYSQKDLFVNKTHICFAWQPIWNRPYSLFILWILKYLPATQSYRGSTEFGAYLNFRGADIRRAYIWDGLCVSESGTCSQRGGLLDSLFYGKLYHKCWGLNISI